jgi:hypothetical protein
LKRLAWNADCSYDGWVGAFSDSSGRQKDGNMMRGIVFVVVMLLFCVPAYAQHATPAGGATSSANGGGGGGFGGGGGGGGYGGFASGGNFSFSNSAPTTFLSISAHGDNYVPSTYLPYDEAVKLGREIQEAKPRNIVEVAAETRAKKHSS